MCLNRSSTPVIVGLCHLRRMWGFWFLCLASVLRCSLSLCVAEEHGHVGTQGCQVAVPHTFWPLNALGGLGNLGSGNSDVRKSPSLCIPAHGGGQCCLWELPVGSMWTLSQGYHSVQTLDGSLWALTPLYTWQTNSNWRWMVSEREPSLREPCAHP